MKRSRGRGFNDGEKYTTVMVDVEAQSEKEKIDCFDWESTTFISAFTPEIFAASIRDAWGGSRGKGFLCRQISLFFF